MNEVVAEADGSTQVTAKHSAAELLFDTLVTCCWTIQTKQYADTTESGLSKKSVLGSDQTSSSSMKPNGQQDKPQHSTALGDAIGESNIGNKLLKLMGWTGGGLGKDGTGIDKPIAANAVVHREGLGLQAVNGVGAGFVPKISKVINDYIGSDREDDLVFSSEFSKEQRALIHRHAQKLGLKTLSHGKDQERFITISRKRSPSQLIQHIWQQGGETSKYKLIPPITSSTSST